MFPAQLVLQHCCVRASDAGEPAIAGPERHLNVVFIDCHAANVVMALRVIHAASVSACHLRLDHLQVLEHPRHVLKAPGRLLARLVPLLVQEVGNVPQAQAGRAHSIDLLKNGLLGRILDKG
jgi:hypothetical protein